ncbi:hypothetical protein VP758_005187 [Vibrio harveyi]|nr:hypothetical protein [Vibrio harveyi]
MKNKIILLSAGILVSGISQANACDDIISECYNNGELLELILPAKNHQYLQGEDLPVEFRMPTEYKIKSIFVNENRIEVPDYVSPGYFFYQYMSGLTNQNGPAKIKFELLTKEGKILNFERQFYIQEQQTPMVMVSPKEGVAYQMLQKIPFEFIPSSKNKEPKFEVYINDVLEKTLIKEPFSFLYQTGKSESLNIRVVEYDNENFVTEQYRHIYLEPVRSELKVSSSFVKGNANINFGESVIIEAEVKKVGNGEKISKSEADKKIESVEFYLNENLIGIDKEYPYQVEWTAPEILQDGSWESRTKAITLNVNMKGYNLKPDLEEIKYLQVLNGKAVEYCDTTVSDWDNEKEYVADDIVTFNGFLYRSREITRGEIPATNHLWEIATCDNNVLLPTAINFIRDESTPRARIGDTISLTGKLLPAPEGVKLKEIFVKDSEGKRKIKPKATGEFSFEHTFKGESNCFIGRCDHIYVTTVNHLGFKKTIPFDVYEAQPPRVEALWLDHESTLYITVADDTPKFSVNVYNRSGKLVGQALIDNAQEVHNGLEKVYRATRFINLNLSPDDTSVIVEVTDKHNMKSTYDVNVGDFY